MSNDDLYFTFDLGENDSINANYDLEENNNIDANFNIYAAGVTWGSISGDIINQPDLYNNLTNLQEQITVNGNAITEINGTLATYGDIVTHNVSDFATAAQGALADTALQPGANISRLTNNVGYITASALNGYATQLWVTDRGYITGINSTDVVTALGYTPYNATNPSGYITSADLPTIEDLTTTAQLAAINSGATTTNIGQIATNTQAISTETANRQNADNALQSQIDALIVSSDVFDVVGTYAELQAYNISIVPVNDIIKVLVDSTHDNAATYYRCVETGGVKSWSYIGAEGAYYTKAEADAKFVEQTVTINGKPLSNNITLTASDVGALADTTFIPTDTSDLTNGAGFITTAALANYVTTNTDQSITGYKNFTNGFVTSGITCNNSTFGINVNNKLLMGCSSNNIDIGNGDRTITFLPPSTQTRPYWGSSNNTLALSSDIPTIPTNYVTTDTAQDISGRKTFLGEKAIYFKQNTTSNKLGFTLYNPSNAELGAFEYRPNTISGGALLNVNVPYSSSDYVGFRYWGTAVNIIAPKVSTAGSYYIPVNITNGTSTVTANNAGTVDISSLFPSNTNYDGQWVASNSTLASGVTSPTTDNITYDLSNYLPADASTYDYEVALDGRIFGGNVTGNKASLVVSGVYQTEIATNIARSNASYRQAGAARLVISHTNRTLTVIADAENTGTFYLRIRGYRRLGTNA